MDPLTALGAVASVAQLAATALSLSKTLYSLGAAIASASDDIQVLADDLKTFSQSLTLLSRLLEDSKSWYSDDIYLLTAKIIRDCADLYLKIDKILDKLGGKGKSTWKLRVKFVVYKEGQIRKLLNRLRDMKGTLATILMSLQVDLQLSLLNISSSSKIQRPAEKPLEPETLRTLKQAQEAVEAGGFLPKYTVHSEQVVLSSEGVELASTRYEISSEIQWSSIVSTSSAAYGKPFPTLSRGLDPDNTPFSNPFNVTQDFAVLPSLDQGFPPVIARDTKMTPASTSTMQDLCHPGDRFQNASGMSHERGILKEGKHSTDTKMNGSPTKSLKSTSSTESFKSAMSLQEEDLNLARKVKAVQSVMHAFRTALEILDNLVDRRIHDKHGELYLAAKKLEDSLDNGGKAIDRKHISHFKQHGQSYIQLFTEPRSVKLQSISSNLMAEVVMKLHEYSAEHEDLQESCFEALQSSSENNCRRVLQYLNRVVNQLPVKYALALADEDEPVLDEVTLSAKIHPQFKVWPHPNENTSPKQGLPIRHHTDAPYFHEPQLPHPMSKSHTTPSSLPFIGYTFKQFDDSAGGRRLNVEVHQQISHPTNSNVNQFNSNALPLSTSPEAPESLWFSTPSYDLPPQESGISENEAEEAFGRSTYDARHAQDQRLANENYRPFKAAHHPPTPIPQSEQQALFNEGRRQMAAYLPPASGLDAHYQREDSTIYEPPLGFFTATARAKFTENRATAMNDESLGKPARTRSVSRLRGSGDVDYYDVAEANVLTPPSLPHAANATRGSPVSETFVSEKLLDDDRTIPKRIVNVDSPPTPRTPPQNLAHTFTAPLSPATGTLFTINGDRFPHGCGHPIIVDERPLHRQRVPSVRPLVGKRPVCRNTQRSPTRQSWEWESPSSSHTSFNSRRAREIEEDAERIRRDRDAHIGELEAERRREEFIRQQDEEIRRRQAVPAPPRPLRQRDYLRPVVDQSQVLQGMMGGLTIRDERLAVLEEASQRILTKKSRKKGRKKSQAQPIPEPESAKPPPPKHQPVRDRDPTGNTYQPDRWGRQAQISKVRETIDFPGAVWYSELTAEEEEEEKVAATKQQIRLMKQQDVSPPQNALRIEAQAEETSRTTPARLGAQRKRIYNPEKDLDLAVDHLAVNYRLIAEEKAKELKTLNKKKDKERLRAPLIKRPGDETKDWDLALENQGGRQDRPYKEKKGPDAADKGNVDFVDMGANEMRRGRGGFNDRGGRGGFGDRGGRGGARGGDAPSGGGGKHALQDYQMQLMLLEQQNKKRLMMVRQEQDNMMPRTDGPGGQGNAPGAVEPNGEPFQGTSPQDPGSVNSPNPGDQMQRRTPHINSAGMGALLEQGLTLGGIAQPPFRSGDINSTSFGKSESSNTDAETGLLPDAMHSNSNRLTPNSSTPSESRSNLQPGQSNSQQSTNPFTTAPGSGTLNDFDESPFINYDYEFNADRSFNYNFSNSSPGQIIGKLLDSSLDQRPEEGPMDMSKASSFFSLEPWALGGTVDAATTSGEEEGGFNNPPIRGFTGVDSPPSDSGLTVEEVLIRPELPEVNKFLPPPGDASAKNPVTTEASMQKLEEYQKSLLTLTWGNDQRLMMARKESPTSQSELKGRAPQAAIATFHFEGDMDFAFTTENDVFHNFDFDSFLHQDGEPVDFKLGTVAFPDGLAQSKKDSSKNELLAGEQTTFSTPRPAPITSTSDEDGPLFVNNKQFHRILKRRVARQKLEEKLKAQSSRPQKHWLHSPPPFNVRRVRGPGGRFLTREEIAEKDKREELESQATIQQVITNELTDASSTTEQASQTDHISFQDYQPTNIERSSLPRETELATTYPALSHSQLTKLWWQAYISLHTTHPMSFRTVAEELRSELGLFATESLPDELICKRISTNIKRIGTALHDDKLDIDGMLEIMEMRGNVIRIMTTVELQLGLEVATFGWSCVWAFLSIHEYVFASSQCEVPEMMQMLKTSFTNLQDIVAIIARYAVMENLYHQTGGALSLSLKPEYKSSLVALCTTVLQFFATSFELGRKLSQINIGRKHGEEDLVKRCDELVKEIKKMDRECQGFRVLVDTVREESNDSGSEDVGIEDVSDEGWEVVDVCAIGGYSGAGVD